MVHFLALQARQSLAQPLNSALSPKAAIDIKEGVWLYASKTLFTKMGRPDLAHGPEFADSCSVRC